MRLVYYYKVTNNNLLIEYDYEFKNRLAQSLLLHTVPRFQWTRR